MEDYDEEYLKDKMADLRAFRTGMRKAGYGAYVVNLKTAIMLYSMWRR